LEKNLRYLSQTAETAGRGLTATASTARATARVVEAFRIAGVDAVHTEKFALPVGIAAGKTGIESMNVIAEIRGRELPDEFVILAGHLDSTGNARGTLHDSYSAAMVIDAARAIHASGSIPRRSILFVLFGDAEQGMLGARAYVEAHGAELDRVLAAISFDGGTGSVTGYSLGGRKEIMAAVRETLAPVRPLGANQFTTDAKISTDTFDFLLEGIPTLVPNVQAPNSASSQQSSPDASDKTSIGVLKHQVAIAAVAAYALADTDARVGSRQSRNQVEQLLEDTSLDKQMKAAGIWSDWQSGKRGLQR
jgi:Zn-dependent M28 family amino/carboxypeptidase